MRNVTSCRSCCYRPKFECHFFCPKSGLHFDTTDNICDFYTPSFRYYDLYRVFFALVDSLNCFSVDEVIQILVSSLNYSKHYGRK